MLKGIGHVGVAVRDIEKTLAALSAALDIPMPPVKAVPEKGARVAVVDVGPIAIELIEDSSENGMLAEFMKERGEGLHHICILSDDIEVDVDTLRERGVAMRPSPPMVGLRGKKIAFSETGAVGGITVEVSEL